MKKYFFIILIVIIGFAVYFPSFSNSFVWDDNLLIASNSFVKSFRHIFDVFKTELFYSAGGNTDFYRPIQSLTLMLDYSIWHLNPFGYHLTNTLLHIFNSLLVYLLAFILFKDRRASILASLIFLTHPVQVEAVAYISGRADLLAMMFVILSFISYIKYRRKESGFRPYLILSLLFYTIALLSKEAAFILPVILLFYEDKKAGMKGALRPLSFFIMIMAVYASLRFTVLSFKKIPVFENGFYGLYLSILTAFKALFDYVGLLIFPVDLHMERMSILTKPVLYSEILFYAFFTASFVLLFICAKKYSKSIFFSLGWFLIALFPNLGVVVPLNASIAEHWLYLPSFGFFSALALLTYRFLDKQRRGLKVIINLILFTVILILAEVSFKQTFYWEDEMVFFKKTVESSPKSGKAHLGLGLAYFSIGDYQKSKIEFLKADVLDPKSAHLRHNNMAIIYIKEGKLDEAEKEYKKAIKLDPGFSAAYNNLARLYLGKGLLNESYEYLEKTISLNPDFAEPYYNLGMLYRAKKEPIKELEYFKKAVEVDPDYAPALEELANIYLESNKYGEAEKALKRILKVKPGYSASRFRLGTIYLKQRLYKEAEKQYRAALKYDPGLHACRINLAVVLSETGRMKEAVNEYKAVLKSVPDYEKANYNLGLIYKRTGRFDEAIKHFKKVLEKNPNDKNAKEQIKKISALADENI